MQQLVAHQLVHGYQRGHRLLAGSIRPGAGDLRLIDRLSDAAGVSFSRSSSGYLTGYPLPSGNYALAKTWPAPAAERPNVVWTHTLMLPPSALSALSMQPLASLFTAPFEHSSLQGFTEPIAIGNLGNHLPAAVTDENMDRIVSALYWDSPSAWLTVDHPQESCMAIWSQQWPRLRRSFSFCSEALEARHLNGRSFDLLVAPEGRRIMASPLVENPHHRAIQALVDDIGAPGHLRDFLRACGADSGKLSLMPILAEAWTGAQSASGIDRVLAGVVQHAPEPASLRRLKRRLLRGPEALLKNADAVRTFGSLATEAGQCVLSEDAQVASWARHAWSVDRQSVIEVAKRYYRASDAKDGARTAAEESPQAAISVVIAQARASDLAMLAAQSPAVAAMVLARHMEPDWWDAWAVLPVHVNLLASVATRDKASAELASTSLLRLHGGADIWGALDGDRAIAVAGLLTAAARVGQPLSEEWGLALGDARQELFDQLISGLPAQELAVAADAVPFLSSPHIVQWKIWEGLAARTDMWKRSAVRAAIVLVAALQGHGLDADAAVAASYAHLHGIFSSEPASAAWMIVERHVPGHPFEWDRCRRLEAGVARAVEGQGVQARRGILDQLKSGNPREALVNQLQRQSKGARKGKRD